MKKGLDGIERFLIHEGDVRRLEACQSPVWDTALAMIALSDAGVPSDDPALVKAADWLLDEEVRIKGDWAVRRPKLAPGGWAFEFDNDHYPDIDDTAEVVLALRRVRHPQPERVDEAIRRGTEWTVGMQSQNGGWGAFDADNVREMCRDIPFCDFGEVIDEPSADVTAHVLEMLGGEGLADAPAAREGISYLLGEQEDGGSWFGRWGINHVYGTGAAVPALVDCGVPRSDPRLRRAAAWLERIQNPDGGWGEDGRSYDDPAWIGRGPSTASQTAWALIALHALGERTEAVERGLAWLVSNQREDGTWDEPEYTGTGFPGHFYINYHLYRLSFPVMALGALGGGRRAELGRGRRGIRRDDGEPGGATPGHSRRSARSRGGHGPGRGRELPGREPPARPRGSATRSWPSTASRAWSTRSATRWPATGSRCSTGSTPRSTASTPAGCPTIPPCAGWRRSPVESRHPARSRSTAWSRPTASTRP